MQFEYITFFNMLITFFRERNR